MEGQTLTVGVPHYSHVKAGCNRPQCNYPSVYGSHYVIFWICRDEPPTLANKPEVQRVIEQRVSHGSCLDPTINGDVEKGRGTCIIWVSSLIHIGVTVNYAIRCLSCQGNRIR